MITKDRPTIFNPSVVVAVSSVSNGNMKFGIDEDDRGIVNRQNFLDSVGISLDQTTPLSLTYDRDNYTEYRTVTESEKGKSMYHLEDAPVADGLVVMQSNHALFLTLADCCGVVLHDPVNNILMLSHIGRHSAEQDGAQRSVEFLQQNCNSDPSNLKVWLSPAVGKATYPLTKKGGNGLHEEILAQLSRAGVLTKNTEVCEADMAIDDNYFSHSEFKKGSRKFDGRFAVVAMMRGRQRLIVTQEIYPR